MNRLCVIGVGSAGIQSLCHFLSFLGKGWEVYSIRDPEIKPVGIGESTNPNFILGLEKGIDFSIIDDLESINGTLKFGTKYSNWRNSDFVNPFIGGNTAVHFDSSKFSEFVLPRLKNRWGDKFREILGSVTSIEDSGNEVGVVVNGDRHSFDYVIDCTGFPSSYEDYVVVYDAPVNHCLVHNVWVNESAFESLYTGHIATKDGWMFRVPLANRNSYGYLFNDKVSSTDIAKRNFSKVLQLDESKMDNIEYKFNSYYTKKIINGRIIRNGNRAAFFEPLFANSLWIYEEINRASYDYIVLDSSEKICNQLFINSMQEIEAMIAFHYAGGSNFNSIFWKKYKKIMNKKLHSSEKFKEVLYKMRENYKNGIYSQDLRLVFQEQSLYILDRNFNYDFFTKEEVTE